MKFKKSYLKRISKDADFQKYCNTKSKSMKDLDIEMWNNINAWQEPQEPYMPYEPEEHQGLCDQDPDRFRDTVILDKLNIW